MHHVIFNKEAEYTDNFHIFVVLKGHGYFGDESN